MSDLFGSLLRSISSSLLSCSAVFLLLLSSSIPFAHAATEAPAVAEPAKGPHGGRLLEKDGFAVEISIFESGVPPEMRVFSYLGTTPVAPKDVTLNVTLSRLDGEQNQLAFAPEADYLLGDTVIVEPHSYAVAVKAVHQGKTYQWQYDSFEGRVTLNDRMLGLTGIVTERATARLLQQKVHLYGVIAVDPDRQFSVQSPYSGQVQQVLVERGQRVSQGQTLAQLINTNTLKTFVIKAPASGVVSQRLVNPGQVVTSESLFEIVDYTQVFVELSAFPDDINLLKTGQRVAVFDLHQAQQAKSTISFIAPAMTEGHIARVRAVIDNSNGHWRPGMHVNADIVVAEREVALAVRKSAVQSFRDMAVVFAKYGNTFEVRMLEFGAEDDEYIEVLGGLKPDTEYATENSYLLKADVEKDGASHDH
jgi:cobalt-zinc-cadmium efflux system membrane fusion protein